jgi:hypothetical protein|tara:strand:+ start:2032 stop:2445 length:414 start_codon:yes stop_codon:yes gene_type:complete
MNNLNSSIAKTIIRTQDLTTYYSGTTGNYGGATVSPGRLYSGYTCTHVFSAIAGASVRTSQVDATGAIIRITLGPAGEQFAWNHNGGDINGWDTATPTYSMCYCNDPCRAPFAISGETNPSYSNYGETIIGGRPPMG